jgi:hypothetical protein
MLQELNTEHMLKTRAAKIDAIVADIYRGALLHAQVPVSHNHCKTSYHFFLANPSAAFLSVEVQGILPTENMYLRNVTYGDVVEYHEEVLEKLRALFPDCYIHYEAPNDRHKKKGHIHIDWT